MRHPDWQPRLIAALRQLAQQPFQYGIHDCAIGAARVADEITVDGDYLPRLLRQFKYHDEGEVKRVLAAGGGLRKLMTEFMGEPIAAGHAMAGDVALVRDFNDVLVLGIHEGLQVICAGVGPLPADRIECAWRIA